MFMEREISNATRFDNFAMQYRNPFSKVLYFFILILMIINLSIINVLRGRDYCFICFLWLVLFINYLLILIYFILRILYLKCTVFIIFY